MEHIKLLTEFLKIILYGIIQGITEWLPISSTGHMILLDEFIRLEANNDPDFWKLFLVIIQLGSILAVIVLFFNKLNPFSAKKNQEEKNKTWHLWFKVLIAEVPLAIVGLLLDDWFNAHFYNYICVSIALIVYGVAFIVIEKKRKSYSYDITDCFNISYKKAFSIGIIQALSIIPGTSRSGSTIIGAMLLGISRTAAAEFSFFLAIPAMLGAGFLKSIKYIMISDSVMDSNQVFTLVIGFVTSFIVSLIVIKYLMSYVKTHSFSVFGYYRIILGFVVIFFFLIRSIVL